MAAAALIVALILFRDGIGSLVAALGLGLAAWLGIGTLVEFAERVRLFRSPFGEALGRMARTPRAAWGMTVGHFGLALFIAGATASSSWTEEHIQTCTPATRKLWPDGT